MELHSSFIREVFAVLVDLSLYTTDKCCYQALRRFQSIALPQSSSQLLVYILPPRAVEKLKSGLRQVTGAYSRSLFIVQYKFAVVCCESVNLIGYITVCYLLIGISAHRASRLNLM